MKNIKYLISAIILFFVVSCGEDDPVSDINNTEVTVLSLNLYSGGDFDRLTTINDLESLPADMRELWLNVQLNNGEPRFQAIAKIIEDQNPDIISLQEVATWYIQNDGDFMNGVTTPNATDEAFNNFSVLDNWMKSSGLNYTVASRVEVSDWELPVLVGTQDTTPSDIRVKLENVILVRDNISISGDENKKVFSNNDFLMIGTFQFDIINGFQTIALSKGKVDFVVANTRLIGNQYSAKQLNQAAELLSALPNNRPFIVAADANSTPDSEVIKIFTKELSDTWSELRGASNGYTCCMSEDLEDNDAISERETFLFYGDNIEARSIELIGDDSDEKAPNGDFVSRSHGLLARYRVVEASN